MIWVRDWLIDCIWSSSSSSPAFKPQLHSNSSPVHCFQHCGIFHAPVILLPQSSLYFIGLTLCLHCHNQGSLPTLDNNSLTLFSPHFTVNKNWCLNITLSPESAFGSTIVGETEWTHPRWTQKTAIPFTRHPLIKGWWLAATNNVWNSSQRGSTTWSPLSSN